MTRDSIIAQLHHIGKAAEERRNEIIEARCLPVDLVRELKETGAFRLWVAKAYGGEESHVLDLLEVVQTLSYYHGSLGWVLGVTGSAALGSGFLPTKSAQDIFGDPYALTGGFAAPVGKAKRVEGGIQVSGKWSWGSGIRHCTHIVGGVMILSEDSPRPMSALAYFDPKDVTFIDNWKVLGLNGTNSIDYEVQDVFVPDGKWMPFPAREATIDSTLYRFSFLGALASTVAAVGLGLAQRAIDEIISLSQEKVPNGARRPLAERPVVHEKIALMKADYQSAKLLLVHAVERNWEEATQQAISLEAKSELRLAATYAARTSNEIASQAYQLGGGSSVWNGVKLQELLKDAYMVTQHGMVSPAQYEVVGKLAVGGKVNGWLL